MITVFVVIVTMVLVEQGFTVSIDEWCRNKYWYYYNRSIDILYRFNRILGWFAFTLVLADWWLIFIPAVFYITWYFIRKLYILSFE